MSKRCHAHADRRAQTAGVVASILLAGCASPFGGDEVSYCEAATTFQHRTVDALAMDRDSVSVLEDAFNQVEKQAEVVRDAAPEEVKDGWADIAESGNAGEAGKKAIAHADAECGTGLAAIADGLTPAEVEKYGSAGAD